MLPCQSRWSCVTLSTAAAVGSKPLAESSWKLDSSMTQTCGKADASIFCASVSSKLGPMLPATATVLPLRSTSCPVKPSPWSCRWSR